MDQAEETLLRALRQKEVDELTEKPFGDWGVREFGKVERLAGDLARVQEEIMKDATVAVKIMEAHPEARTMRDVLQYLGPAETRDLMRVVSRLPANKVREAWLRPLLDRVQEYAKAGVR